MSIRRVCSVLAGIAGLMIVSPVIASSLTEIPSEAVLTLTYNGLILGGIALIGLVAQRDMDDMEKEFENQIEALWRGIQDHHREMNEDLSKESDVNNRNVEEIWRKISDLEA